MGQKETGYIRRKHKDGTWVKDFAPMRMGTKGGWNSPDLWKEAHGYIPDVFRRIYQI